MAGPTTVEEYLSELPDPQRAALLELRLAVNAAAPDATESIAYQMPALRSHGGQFLVSYAAFKNHYSLFPRAAHRRDQGHGERGRGASLNIAADAKGVWFRESGRSRLSPWRC